MLTGPGIAPDPDSLAAEDSVMLQRQHSAHTGAAMSRACFEHLLGAEDDEEIGPTAVAAIEAGADVAAALRELLCAAKCAVYGADQAAAAKSSSRSTRRKKRQTKPPKDEV